MRHVLRICRICFSALALFLFIVPNVLGATIFIDDLNLEHHTAFSFGQFEGGFSINGSAPATTAGSVFAKGVQLNFTGQWVDHGNAAPFSRSVYWHDPATLNIMGKILSWTITPSNSGSMATISGFFQSGGLGTLPPGADPADIIIEQPDNRHNPFDFTAAAFAGQVITGTRLNPVPETAAGFLFGLGLLGLAGVALKRER